MKKFIKTIGLILSGLCLFSSCGIQIGTEKNVIYSEEKCYQRDMNFRTIITTDGECDDQNSLIHAFLYADQLNIKGIIYTSSILHWGGDEKHAPYRDYGTHWIEEYIDHYAKVYDNLKRHSSKFPTADYLKSITKVGNYSYKNDVKFSTEGSNLIAEEILREDDSKLYLLAWGGCNTIARALMSIEEEHQNDTDWVQYKSRLSQKIVISMISLQDSLYTEYISKNWKDISVIVNQAQFGKYGFNWKGGKYDDTLKAAWQKKYVLHKDNPLLSLYHSYLDGVEYPGEQASAQFGLDINDSDPNDGKIKNSMGTFEQYDFLSEGDSPSFLMLIDNGLEGIDVDKVGSWGGYYVTDAENGAKRIDYTQKYRGNFIPDISRDFAERIRWTEGQGSLHTPSLMVKEGKYVRVKKEDIVTLTAIGTDLDGDELFYDWEFDDTASEYERDDFDDVSPILKVNDNVAIITFRKNTKAGDVYHYYAKVADDEILGSVKYVDVKIEIIE